MLFLGTKPSLLTGRNLEQNQDHTADAWLGKGQEKKVMGEVKKLKTETQQCKYISSIEDSEQKVSLYTRMVIPAAGYKENKTIL